MAKLPSTRTCRGPGEVKPLPRVPPPAPGTQPQRARVLTHRGGRRRRRDGRGASLAPSWVLNGAWEEEARGNRGAPRGAPNASLEARPEAGASSPESSRRGRGRPVWSRAPSLPPAQEGGPAPPPTRTQGARLPRPRWGVGLGGQPGSSHECLQDPHASSGQGCSWSLLPHLCPSSPPNPTPG